MTTTAPELNAQGVYVLTFPAGVIGMPIVNLALLELMTDPTHHQQNAQLIHAIDLGKRIMEAFVKKLDERRQILFQNAAYFGIELPLFPTSGRDFEKWLGEVRATLRAAVQRALAKRPDPLLSPAFEAGSAAAELKLSLGVGQMIAQLRAAAPDNAALKTAVGNVEKTLHSAARRLREALGNPAMPAPVAPQLQKLANLFQSPPELSNLTTDEARSRYSQWSFDVGTVLEDLNPALRDAAASN